MKKSPEIIAEKVKKTAKNNSGIDLKSESLNQIKKGEGKLFHRRYQVEIKKPKVTAENLMSQIQSDISSFCPKFLAHFEKLKGEERRLKVGDQFDVHITGPWPAKVKVLEVGPLHFVLVTKDEHLEAGQINFTIEDKSGEYLFVIESWARSRDWLVNFFYDIIPLIRFGQETMWRAFCKKVAKAGSVDPSAPEHKIGSVFKESQESVPASRIQSTEKATTAPEVKVATESISAPEVNKT